MDSERHLERFLFAKITRMQEEGDVEIIGSGLEDGESNRDLLSTCDALSSIPYGWLTLWANYWAQPANHQARLRLSVWPLYCQWQDWGGVCTLVYVRVS